MSDIPPDQVVLEMWALVVTDANGGQGIPAAQVGRMIHPLICSQMRLVPGLVEAGRRELEAKRIASFKILHFTNPEEFDHTTFK